MSMYATYSPEDNKLRLYPSSRLPKDLYDRVKAAGFIWAPKQELFVAPAWTPTREDLLTELCGEIGDEDTSLVDRAEERAERFEDYSDKREADAHQAHAAVDAIADNIPLGQPILVGHHSERHARKDAERIRNGMTKAVKMWETAKYWTQRAAGAIHHAKYKERPDVRARRIKGLEAEIRKCKARYTPSDNKVLMQKEYSYATGIYSAEEVPHVWCAPRGGRGGSWVPVYRLPAIEAGEQRWIAHYENRLAYERAMLAEQGGTAADKYIFEIGGQVRRRGDWYVITKINRVGGVVNSVSVLGHFASTVTMDEISDYKAPQAGDAAKVAAVTDKGPICNYPGEGFHGITQAMWDSAYKDHKGTQTKRGNEQYGTHRVRFMANYKLRGLGLKIKDQWGHEPVWITDAKRKDAPKPTKAAAPKLPEVEREAKTYTPRKAEEPTVFDAMADSLKAGVKVVTAPQLFPTPPDLAARLVELANLHEGHRILEPSAGTGNLVRAIRAVAPDAAIDAVEISPELAPLSQKWATSIRCADFLELNGELGTFDRIIMNPPFTNGADIKHIEHARTKLKPGGRLVAICANGPRQRETLMPEAGEWHDLSEGSFNESGTNVNAAIVVFDAQPAPQEGCLF
jgi:protein-L-isoaspartate O-methyltransferase